MLVVGGVGLVCALGGVLFYQLSKDEEALRKGREVRRRRWGLLEEAIKGHSEELDTERRRAAMEAERRERERREQEKAEKEKRTGWKRMLPW